MERSKRIKRYKEIQFMLATLVALEAGVVNTNPIRFVDDNSYIASEVNDNFAGVGIEFVAGEDAKLPKNRAERRRNKSR